MLRILAFFAVVLVAGLGFAWLADNPGSVLISWRGQELATSFMVFLIAAVLLVALAVLLFWLLTNVFRAPERVGQYFGRRRREKGYQALSAGILAAGAGDAQTARRLVGKSEKWLSSRREPLIRFLDAQTAMIEGDHDRARRVFESMEKEPATRLLALRGLYLESERVNDPVAARRYAEQAARIAPTVPWAGSAVLELKAKDGDFDGALEALAGQRHSRMVEKAESRRLRAVLLTGKAMELSSARPQDALAAAGEAQKLAPDLVQAALVAARAAIRLDDQRKATKILESAWKASPHPEIGELYLRTRAADGPTERLRRARRLQSLQPGHAEGHIIVARAALDARDFPLARSEAEAAAAKAPRESTYLLLADIEEADGNDLGRVRAWMTRAIGAPKDPVWMADGVPAPDWIPVSPTSGRLDAFRWTEPAEHRNRVRPVLPEPDAEDAEIVGGRQLVMRETAPRDVSPRPAEPEPVSPAIASTSPAAETDERKEARFAS